MAESSLRVLAVKESNGTLVFLWNRYKDTHFKPGDTILADADICLTAEEQALVEQVRKMELPQDGDPMDIFAGLAAKLFQAGMES